MRSHIELGISRVAVVGRGWPATKLLWTGRSNLRVALILAAATIGVSACATASGPPPRTFTGSSAPPALTPAPNVTGNPVSGRTLFISKGCGGCHTNQAAPGANGVAGPNLNNVSLKPTLAGDAIQTSPANMARWITDAPGVKPGTQMPRLELTQQEIQDIVAFLYSQPYNPTR